MNRLKRYSYIFAATLASGLTLTGCGNDEPEPGTSGHKTADRPQRAMLVYAVATNNLSTYLEADMTEMLAGALNFDAVNNKVVVYSVTPDGISQLRELSVKADNSGPEFVTVKEYPRLPLSVSKERIAEVIGDFRDLYDAYPDKSLTFWSHSSGWTPTFDTPPGSDPAAPKATLSKTFGWDNYGDGTHYECNITDLADAVPEGVFDFIWFDCCYMSNIETLYQMRDKAPYIVAYPTEVYGPGLPYDATLPYVMRPEPDLAGAAEELFKYYDRNSRAVTVAVIRTDRLQDVAQAAAGIIDDFNLPQTRDLHNYATGRFGPFFDMRHTLSQYPGADDASRSRLDRAVESAVVAAYASERDFRGRPIAPEKFCGITIHLLDGNSTSKESEFYRQLDWYRATRR